MEAEDRRTVPGQRSEPTTLAGAIELLEQVEGLPRGLTGILGFEDGVILVDAGRICWARAPDMRQHLADVLSEVTNPPLSRTLLEDVFRQCKAKGTPFGETLVASGLVSEFGLRSALVRHNAEAIARLAHGSTRPTGFASHSRSSYDPRFAFTTSELLAAVAVRRDRSRAALARAHLAEIKVQEAVGFAFVRDLGGATPVLIAVDRECSLRVAETLAVGRWVTGLFDVTVLFDPETKLISATWCSSTAVVAWRMRDVNYAALCSSRPASALLLNQLARRLEVGGERYSGTMRARS